MQKLAEVCIRRPIFATMIVLALVVVGSASYFRLGVDRFPNVDIPTISVTTRLPGAAPEQIETEVTDKVEESVNTISGHMKSFHVPSSVKTASVTTIGLSSGTTTIVKIRHSLAPSILAASSRSSGMDSAY